MLKEEDIMELKLVNLLNLLIVSVIPIGNFTIYLRIQLDF
jgi:hypothetical protein